jgi:hypothetical protein
VTPPLRKTETLSPEAKALWRLASNRLAVQSNRSDAFIRDMDNVMKWMKAQSDGTKSRFITVIDRVSLAHVREGRDPATAVVLAVLDTAHAIGLRT